MIGATKGNGEDREPAKGKTDSAEPPLGKHEATEDQTERLQSNGPEAADLQ